MKGIYAFLLFCFVMLSAVTHTFACSAPADIYTVSMTQNSEWDSSDDDTTTKENEKIKHRVSPRPIICTISNDGIDIPNYTSDDIILYEAYTTDGICIASFTTEQEFVDFIYSTNGTIEIRLHIEDSVYQGYLTL